MAGTRLEVETDTRAFLDSFEQIPLDQKVAEQAVTTRREMRIKLPDAIIRTTARSRSMLLVTRNGRDFPASEPWVRIPYSR